MLEYIGAQLQAGAEEIGAADDPGEPPEYMAGCDTGAGALYDPPYWPCRFFT